MAGQCCTCTALQLIMLCKQQADDEFANPRIKIQGNMARSLIGYNYRLSIEAVSFRRIATVD